MFRNSKVLEAIKLLPEEYSMADLIDKIRLLDKIDIGLYQAEKGHVISDEELDIEIAEWFN
jgi:hypothetical protein